MSKIKPYKEQETDKMSVGEPVADAAISVQNRQMPDFVQEDIRIGLEEYERGECEDAWAFLKTLKR